MRETSSPIVITRLFRTRLALFNRFLDLRVDGVNQSRLKSKPNRSGLTHMLPLLIHSLTLLDLTLALFAKIDLPIFGCAIVIPKLPIPNQDRLLHDVFQESLVV